MSVKPVIPFLVFLFSGALFAGGFNINKLGPLVSKVPKPTARLAKFDIRQISLRDVTFTFVVGISNPYPVGLKLRGVNLDFSVETNRIFHTTTSSGFSVGARKVRTNSFDVTIAYESIIRLIRDYTSRDYLECNTDVLVMIPIPQFMKGLPRSVDFPFRLTQKIPAIKPKVSVAGFKVVLPTQADVKTALASSAVTAAKNLDVTTVQNMFSSILQGKSIPKPVISPADIDLKFKVMFDIVMQNEAKAPFDFTALQFNFMVNSNQLVTSLATNVRKVGTTTTLSVVNEFSSKSLGASVLNAFKTGTGNFSLSGKTSLKLPASVINHPLTLDFREDGTFKLR